MIDLLWLYLLVGAGAGLLAGLLGVGGGLLLVPALAFSFAKLGFHPAHIMPMALGTSLGAIVLTALSSLYAHQRRGAVLWPVFKGLAPGLLLGALAGAALASLIGSSTLRTVFGVFELLVAAQMALTWAPAAHRALPGRWGRSVAGAVIGALSALLGIGGGTLSVPFLVWCNITMRQAVATSAACGLPIALAGAAGYALQGWHLSGLPNGTTGYLYWPALIPVTLASMATAPLGARLAHTLPTPLLKRLFAGVLAVIGVNMLAT